MYHALVLTEQSKSDLLGECLWKVPESWEIIAHHVTIGMGNAPEQYKEFLNKKFKVLLEAFAFNEKHNVFAAKVQIISDTLKRDKGTPHITIGVDRNNGGKPVLSNEIYLWNAAKNKIFLECTYEEVS